MSRVALVGGSGFIGTRLAAALAGRGAEVTVLDRERPRAPGAAWVHCDVRLPGLGGAPLAGYDAVFLLAALLAKRCGETPEEGWRTNVAGVGNAVEALRQAGGAPRVVFFSSAMVYAPGCPPCVAEDAPLEGAGLYGHGKVFGERLLEAAADTLGWDVAVLRPFTVYGPGPAAGERGHFVARWMELARAGVPLTVHGDGTQTLDLVHLDDVAAICAAVLDRPRVAGRFQAFNVGSGRETSVLQLAGWFRDALPGVRVEHQPERRGPFERRFADVGRAGAELGWHPRVDPRDGIAALLRDVFPGGGTAAVPRTELRAPRLEPEAALPSPSAP